jgi:hypothetical protein
MHILIQKPYWVFPVAKAVSSSHLPFVSCGVPSTEVADLKIDVQSSTGLAFSQGSHLLEHFGDVLKEVTRFVAPNLVDCFSSERRRWEKHRGELWMILTEFFTSAQALPAMIWTHCLVWTDRSVALSASGSTIVRDRPQDPIQYEGHGTVELCFSHRKSRKSGVRDDLTINTSRIRWAYPVDMPKRPRYFVKCVEDCSIVPVRRGKNGLIELRPRVRSGLHAEQLGPAMVRFEGARGLDIETCIRHRHCINTGLFPYLKDKTYALWRERDTGNPRVGRLQPPGADPSRFELIDSLGVLDVQTLKAQRLFERQGDVVRDELTIKFDRESSRVVSIGCVRDDFGCPDRDDLCRSVLETSLRGVRNPEGGVRFSDIPHPLAYPKAILNADLGEVLGTGSLLARGQG